MTEELSPAAARSFGQVAAAYDRARPTYPADAVAWLVGTEPCTVLELGAGTGKLTRMLLEAGHDVIATEPDPAMARVLEEQLDLTPVVASAEHIPLRSRSVDVVVCAQAFHWFDHEVALPEIARVLRPEGFFATAWNRRDEGIPWVRKLGRLIGNIDVESRLTPLLSTPFFGFVEEEQFRSWQTHTAATLLDLARSQSRIALAEPAVRDETLARVKELYDSYGRGPDGMQLAWLTRCFRAVVRHDELPPELPVEEPVADLDTTTPAAPGWGSERDIELEMTQPLNLRATGSGSATRPPVQPDLSGTTPVPGQIPGQPLPGQSPARHDPPEDTGTLLIDFR